MLEIGGASPDALRQHVESALRLGWLREEIIEVLIQSATHTGVPGALRALAECHDLLVERDPCAQSCEAKSSETGQW
jgi:4-carboxymuconolactone decarboxylase